ncbi:MAG TPA: redoxin family protein [Acidimicrobiia bacterium]|nr:redoxin family protein [Acidimicrobiia bacterium]
MSQPRRRAYRRPRWGLVVGGLVAMIIIAAITAALVRHDASQPQSARLSLGAPAPDGSFTTIDGQTTSIAALRGKSALVWFVTTYCGSCQAGTQIMADHIDRFAQHHVKVVELQLADNLGGDGPDIATFGRRIANKQFTNPAWLWGTASHALTTTYDPKAFLDVYYLIDARGRIAYVNGSPDATIDTLLEHVRSLDS